MYDFAIKINQNMPPVLVTPKLDKNLLKVYKILSCQSNRPITIIEMNGNQRSWVQL